MFTNCSQCRELLPVRSLSLARLSTSNSLLRRLIVPDLCVHALADTISNFVLPAIGSIESLHFTDCVDSEDHSCHWLRESPFAPLLHLLPELRCLRIEQPTQSVFLSEWPWLSSVRELHLFSVSRAIIPNIIEFLSINGHNLKYLCLSVLAKECCGAGENIEFYVEDTSKGNGTRGDRLLITNLGLHFLRGDNMTEFLEINVSPSDSSCSPGGNGCLGLLSSPCVQCVEDSPELYQQANLNRRIVCTTAIRTSCATDVEAYFSKPPLLPSLQLDLYCRSYAFRLPSRRHLSTSLDPTFSLIDDYLAHGFSVIALSTKAIVRNGIFQRHVYFPNLRTLKIRAEDMHLLLRPDKGSISTIVGSASKSLKYISIGEWSPKIPTSSMSSFICSVLPLATNLLVLEMEIEFLSSGLLSPVGISSLLKNVSSLRILHITRIVCSKSAGLLIKTLPDLLLAIAATRCNIRSVAAHIGKWLVRHFVDATKLESNAACEAVEKFAETAPTVSTGSLYKSLQQWRCNLNSRDQLNALLA